MDCAKLDSMVERMKNAFMKYMNAKEKVEESYRNTCSKFLTTLSELNEKHMLNFKKSESISNDLKKIEDYLHTKAEFLGQMVNTESQRTDDI